MTVLVDTNVLLDIVTDDPVWYDWSSRRLEALALQNSLVINDVIFAELCPGFARFEEVDDLVGDMGLAMRPIPHAALFLASKVHETYRGRGGKWLGVLPDFFIGAQAAVEGLPVVTRDVQRFRTYFPTVELITP